jgi:hypothetical protein
MANVQDAQAYMNRHKRYRAVKSPWPREVA